MAEELQSLLEKIQKDGVEKARTEAERILEDARQQADTVRKQAEEEARNRREAAEREAKDLQERGQRALEQAARDVILTLKGAIEATLRALVRKDVAAALDPAATADILKQVVDAYCKDRGGTPSLELLVPEELRDRIAEHFLGRLTREMQDGVAIKGDGTVLAGFRVSVKDDQMEHDFSDEAITDALCSLLRPHLANIVKSADRED